MARINYCRVFFGFLFSIFLISTTFATYPQLEFTQSGFDSGQVDITAMSSSGTQIELYVNDNYIGQQDIFAPSKTVVLDGSDIENQQIALGQTIKFVNEDFRTYQINISGEVVKTLNYGDSISYTGREVGQVTYRDEIAGVQRTIDVVDELASFNFSDVTTYMVDGSNTIKFIQKYPYPTFEESSEEIFTANYEKFSNTIDIKNFTNVTDIRMIKINGSVADSTDPLYYLLNLRPEGVGNAGALAPVELTGGSFEVTVGSLREGVNNIYFVSSDPSNPNIFTGMKTVRVLVDTIAPDIEINSVKYRDKYSTADTVLGSFDDELYINGQALILNLSTDAVLLNYTYNDQNFTTELDNGSALIDLGLELGQNNLTLTAIDVAGNIYKEAHNIYFDDREPDLIDESLEPEEMFEGSKGVARFFFQEVEGKTNKPNVEMTIFTLPEDATDFDDNPVTCESYKPIFIRNLGQLDGQVPEGPELNIEEYQFSLTSLMFQKVTTESDSDGEFEAIIGLQEKTFDYGDYVEGRTEPEQVHDVKSRNQICFVLKDKFGNVNVVPKRVTLDAGNTMWRSAEITTIPNTLYAAEIAQAGDVRAGTGNVEFAMIANFDYIGPGTVTSLNSITIAEDVQVSEHSKYIVLDKSRMNYMLNKDTGKLVVHVPVKILPIKNLEPKDYPEELKFGFSARVTYSVDDTDIPIDEKNPIYFQTSIDVERPLDHTKWLTPEMIDKWVGYLNKTIDFTETAVDWTGKASIVGVLGCTASKFWYGITIATPGTTQEDKWKAQEKMFTICDRVACTASPQRCEGNFAEAGETGNGIFAPPEGTTSNSYLQGEALEGDAMIYNNYEEKDKLAQFDTLKIGQECDYNKNGSATDGVYVSGRITKFEEEGGAWSYTATSEGMVTDFCAPVSYKDDGTIDKINLQGASGACFQKGPPTFDNTRCMIPGLESTGAAGWDPSDNIIESVRCGCITDTYSHLKNYLKIMKAIRGCLIQAKLGEVEGSYCERLVGQSVCDIATNVIFRTINQKSTRKGTDGTDPHDNVFLKGLQGLKEGDKILNDRYEGTIYEQAGLGSEDIVNKMCMVALTGDWSVLSESILSSIDQNQVEPMFGPMIPESRIQGYNPLTGDLSIQYRFTYAGVSGGQNIRSYVEFICDSEAPGGKYCPPGYNNAKALGSQFSVKTLFIREGGSAQDTVVVTDTRARYRYNVIQLTHKYELKGEQKEKVIKENVIMKGEEMIANCYFSAGVQPGSMPAITCDTLFSNDALLSVYRIREDKTSLVPNRGSAFFPGNSVFLRLGYDIRTDEFNSQSAFDLAYVATCPARGDNAKAVKKGVEKIDIGEGSFALGNKVIELFKLPSVLGAETSEGYSQMSVHLSKAELDSFKDSEAKLVFYNLNGIQSNMFKITDATGLDKNHLPAGILGQQLNVNAVNSEDAKSGAKVIPHSVFGTYSSQGSTITLKFDQKVKDLAVAFVLPNNNEKLFSTTNIAGGSEYEFDKLAEGTCTLELKLLPSGQGEAAIADISKFKDYTSYGDDIQTDSNLAEESYYKTSFTLAQAPTEQLYNVEVVEPFKDASYCLDESNTKLPFYYILQTSDNKQTSDGLEAKYTVTFESKTIKKEGTVELRKGMHVSKNTNSIDLSEAIKPLAGNGVQNAQLTYDVYKKVSSNKEEKLSTNTINIVIRVPGEESSCKDISFFYDYKPQTEPEEKTSPSSDGGGPSSGDAGSGESDASISDPNLNQRD